MFALKLKKYCNYHPLEVVGRGGETQLQVGENLNTLTKGWLLHEILNFWLVDLHQSKALYLV